MGPKKDATLCKNISKKISEYRELKYPGHGGQKKCAEDFGIGVTTWNGWEAGRNVPSDVYQRKLASFFDISVAELRGELPVKGNLEALHLGNMGKTTDIQGVIDLMEASNAIGQAMHAMIVMVGNGKLAGKDVAPVFHEIITTLREHRKSLETRDRKKA